MFGFVQRLTAKINEKDVPDQARQQGATPPSLAKLRALLENHRLAELLPYESYDPDTQVFHQIDSYGFLLECMPLTGANQETAEVLSGLFDQAWPDGTCIQLTLWPSPNVLHWLDAWKAMRVGDPTGIYQAMAERRMAFLQHGMTRSLFRDQPFLLRDFQVFVSVTFPGTADDTAVARLLNLRDAVCSVLKAAGLVNRVCSADVFVGLLDEILNPRSAPRTELPYWDEGRLLRDQVVDGDTSAWVAADGLVLNETAVRNLSVRRYPKKFALAGMGDLIGDLFQTAMQLPCPALFTLGIYIPDQDGVRRAIDLKAARAITQAEAPIAKYVPSMQSKAQDWRMVQEALNEGQSVLRIYHQLVLFSPLDRAEQDEQAVRSLFRAKNWTLQSDRYMQMQGLLGALPLSLSQTFFKEIERLGRSNTKLSWNAINLAPLLGEWKGTNTPRLMLFGRRGQVMHFDFFDNHHGNYNVAIAAASGSGKSFLMNEIATSYVGTGGRGWIIDVGRSYERTCKILEGQFIEFTEEARLGINPFTHVTNFNEELPMLKAIVAQMAAPTRTTDDLENAFIEKAISTVWEHSVERATITEIAAWLTGHQDPRAQDLGHMLYPYTRHGAHRRFFEGASTLEFDRNLIVLELEELKAKKDLQAVTLLIVMLQIQQAMYLGDRDQRKVCMIDEAWDLFGAASAAEFIETGYRRVRKYGGSFITATQGINDYYKYPAAQAAFENSDWVMLLRQKDESIEQLEKSGRLTMDAGRKRLLRSVKTVHGKYSEVAISGPMGLAVGRLIVDPWSGMLYSTQAEDFARIKELEGQGLSLPDAIEQLLHEQAQRRRH